MSQWQQAGLLRPSAIKPVFAALSQRLVIRQLGKLQPADMQALRTAMADILGYP